MLNLVVHKFGNKFVEFGDTIIVVSMTDITDKTNSVLLAFYKNYKNYTLLERKNYLFRDVKPFSLAICFPKKSQSRPKTCVKMG